jgi:peptide chain release factor 2
MCAICARGSSSWEVIFDQARRQAEIAELEEKAAKPDLWEDAAAAQVVLQRLSQARESLAPYLALTSRLDDLEVMIELLAEEAAGESEDLKAAAEEAVAIRGEMDQIELEILLSGEHDALDCIVEIKAGAGGTDACDWVTMLREMYLKWALSRGYKCDVIDDEGPQRLWIHALGARRAPTRENFTV